MSEISDAQLGAAVRTIYAALFGPVNGVPLPSIGKEAGVANATAAEKPKATTKAAAKAEPKAEPQPQDGQAAGTQDEAKAESEIDQPTVLKAVLAYANKNGKAAGEALLAEFSASRVGELDPGDYPAVIARIEELAGASSLA